MTLMEECRRGVPETVRRVAEEEGIRPEKLARRVAEGRVVVPAHADRREEVRPVGIGEGLRVKVNANVGTSPEVCDPDLEVEKARAAVEHGADTVMDLSTGGDLGKIRRRIMEAVDVPVGTVPVYEAAVEATSRGRAVVDMDEDDMLRAVERHMRDGVDFMTIHCAVTWDALNDLLRRGRLLGVVSRGGAIVAAWMIHHEEENPLYEHFDYILELAREHDVTLSLGDAMRPGSVLDANDPAQHRELLVQGELVDRCREHGVQAMVEGPGHVPLDQIPAVVRLQKRVCDGAPFYVLGPVPTDVAPGYDHIAAAIGGAIAAYHGADFLCYVTPAEHLALPDVRDVIEGVIAARIAAHAADTARGREYAVKENEEMGRARWELDWERQFELALDPERARRYREERPPQAREQCSMCGEYCAIKIVREALERQRERS
ncbi:phosphomethylpyrimidine synthase [Methanopyrus sp.]